MLKKETKKLKNKIKSQHEEFDLTIDDLSHIPYIDGCDMFMTGDSSRTNIYSIKDGKFNIVVRSKNGGEILNITTDKLTGLRQHFKENTVISDLSQYTFLNYLVNHYSLEMKFELYDEYMLNKALL